MEKPNLLSGCLPKLLLLFFAWGAFPATFAAYKIRKNTSERIRWIYYYDQISTYDFKISKATLRHRFKGSYYYWIEGEVLGQFSTTLSIDKGYGQAIFETRSKSPDNHHQIYYPKAGQSVQQVYAIPSQELARLPNRYGTLTERRKLIYDLIPILLLIYLPVIYAWCYLIRIISILLMRWQGKMNN